MDRTISDKVGENGVNLHKDVVAIQELLNEIKMDDGGASPNLKVDGKCGQKTKDAIQKFQLRHFGWKLADSRVDPNGVTLQRMNECAGGPAAWKKNMIFRIRRQLPDSFTAQPGVVDIFELNDQLNRRKAVYALVSGQYVQVPPGMIPPHFAGGWAMLHATAPMAIFDLGGPAALKTEVKQGQGSGGLTIYSTTLQVRTKSGSLGGLMSFTCKETKPGYFKLVAAYS